MRNVATAGKRIGHGWYYNFFAVTDSKGLAPNGWRVPTDAEWKEMEIHLGMSQEEADRANTGPGDTNLRGTNEGGKLKSKINEWLSPNEGATNETQFNAFPSGIVDRHSTNGYNMTDRAVFWCKDETYLRRLLYYSAGISRYDTFNNYGFSVRCIQDKAAGESDGTTGTLTDIDGNIYKWVVIGDYRWMAENLRTTKYKNGTNIPHVTNDTEWANLTTGARCAYNNDPYTVYPPNR